MLTITLPDGTVIRTENAVIENDTPDTADSENFATLEEIFGDEPDFPVIYSHAETLVPVIKECLDENPDFGLEEEHEAVVVGLCVMKTMENFLTERLMMQILETELGEEAAGLVFELYNALEPEYTSSTPVSEYSAEIHRAMDMILQEMECLD